MFYDKLISLCNRDGIKPTPLIRKLGFSAGNIKRWENGATVNSDILIAVAKHFKVSIDYLLTGQEESSSASNLNADEQEMLNIYKKLSEIIKPKLKKEQKFLPKWKCLLSKSRLLWKSQRSRKPFL